MNNKIIETGSLCTIWLQSYDGFSTCVRKLNYQALHVFTEQPAVCWQKCHYPASAYKLQRKAAYLAMSIKPLVAAVYNVAKH